MYDIVSDFELGFSLKRLREFRNLTQKDIANKLKISQSGYRKKESGVVYFNLKEFNELCEIFSKSGEEMNIIISNK